MVTATIAEPFARAIKASSSAAAAVGLLPVSSVLEQRTQTGRALLQRRSRGWNRLEIVAAEAAVGSARRRRGKQFLHAAGEASVSYPAPSLCSTRLEGEVRAAVAAAWADNVGTSNQARPIARSSRHAQGTQQAIASRHAVEGADPLAEHQAQRQSWRRVRRVSLVGPQAQYDPACGMPAQRL